VRLVYDVLPGLPYPFRSRIARVGRIKIHAQAMLRKRILTINLSRNYRLTRFIGEKTVAFRADRVPPYLAARVCLTSFVFK
jgi:hypothetical protein